MSDCTFRNNLIDDAGVFWYFAPDAGSNASHDTIIAETTGLWVRGDRNIIADNVITNSHADSMVVEGSGNVLMNNIVDHDVIVRGSSNTVHGLVFTTPEARLRLYGTGHNVFGVPEDRIIRE